MTGPAAAVVTLAYICALFAIAYFGDARRIGAGEGAGASKTSIYALSVAVYCTGWTYFGSIGLASSSGLLFLPIYIGPILVVTFGRRLIERVIVLSKAQNIVSVADFVAARYGKAQSVAMCIALVSIVGAVPYIALQLKAVSAALELVIGSIDHGRLTPDPAPLHTALPVALVLAGFAMAFGTRRVEATERQHGLMLAVATESLVKLVAFLAVGGLFTWGAFGGFGDIFARASQSPRLAAVFAPPREWLEALVMTLLSAIAILLLPRQFHVLVVENRSRRDVGAVAWLLPAYLIAINLFVIPLAVAGLVYLPDAPIDRDMTILALPISAGWNGMAVLAMIGGVSAATAMIVVECVALSIMASNDLVLPLYLRARRRAGFSGAGSQKRRILLARRFAILAVLAAGYAYLRISSDAGLVAIGLISFACVGQIAPAFFGGLYWRGGSAAGAIAGMLVGFALWAYTLFLPSIAEFSPTLGQWVEHGPAGLSFLRPTRLFGLGLPQFAHGVLVSLGLNIAFFVGVSLWRRPSRIERVQAADFLASARTESPGALRLWRSEVTAGEIEATVARYLGAERTRTSFDSFYASRGVKRVRSAEADAHLLRYAEKLLASAIGAASSRLVLSLVLKRRTVSHQAALRLVDEASAAIQYNRDLLQYALDFARQGITVFDRERRLICWNREYKDLFDLPQDVLRVGLSLEDIVRFNAQRGLYGPDGSDATIRRRVDLVVNERRPTRVRLAPTNRVIEIRSAGMPEGGFVTTYLDVTAQVDAEEALEATNETLEQRVRERTLQLERLNSELDFARAAAEEANLSKTRFLAAASHDILQPLNAARLYATSLAEKAEGGELGALSNNVDVSLEAVEEILTTLLDISRLDAGAMRAEFGPTRLDDLFRQLNIEFAPMAAARGLKLTFVRTSLAVRSDRRLLRRVLQNFVSNAIKYTQAGRILVGARRAADGRARVEVWDTGVGIPEKDRREVFREFARLDSARRSAPGLGLGLSIVERIARALEAELDMRSRVGVGSVFSLSLPRAAEAPAPEAAAACAPPARQPLTGTVLAVIDNEPRILDGLRAMLSGWGCALVAEGSIPALLAALPPQPPAAILADLHLDDGEDGFAAIEAVRAHYGAPIPAILSTADRTETIREQAARADIRVLPKPLKPAALRALLTQWRASASV